MALKEFKGRMLPSAPSSTLTMTLSMPLQCGSFSCNMVRILVLPSGSVSLLMLATDFELEMVENDCLRNSVLWSWKEAPWRSPLCCPWRSALSPWRSSVFSSWRLSDWSWKEADSMLYALLVTGLLLDLDWHGLPLPLCPLDMLQDFLFPPPDCLDLHWVLKWFFIATLMTLFAPCWAFSRWVRRSTLTAYLTLTSGLLALTFPLLWRSWFHLLWLMLQLLCWTCIIGSP